jgi:hypothetical protein
MHEITREGIKETGLDPVGQAGGVFAGPLLSKLEDGSSKTPIHLLRKKTRFSMSLFILARSAAAGPLSERGVPESRESWLVKRFGKLHQLCLPSAGLRFLFRVVGVVRGEKM